MQHAFSTPTSPHPTHIYTQVLDPQRRVLFLDTAEAGAREALAGDTLSNAGEAGLVVEVLQAAAAAGIAQERVGVISPYRAQVEACWLWCAAWLACLSSCGVAMLEMRPC